MEANNAVTFSWEFRFPLYQFPQVGEVVPDRFSRALGGLSVCIPRLDGALIFDFGRVSRTGIGLLEPSGENSNTGRGAGFGLRVVEPILKLSACADFVWGLSLTTGKPELYYGINF